MGNLLRNNKLTRDWEDLVQRLRILTVNTCTFVPYKSPFQNWPQAFYVASEAAVCQILMMELDNRIALTVENNDKPQNIINSK